MIVFLSHSISSDCPNLSNRIHSLAPPAFFFGLLAATAAAIELFAAFGDGAASFGDAAVGEESAGFFGRRRMLGRRKENGPSPLLSLLSSLSLSKLIRALLLLLSCLLTFSL